MPLLAWRKVDSSRQRKDSAPLSALFERLMATATDSLEPEKAADVRRSFYIMSCAAIGHGLSGSVLAGVLGMSAGELDSVPKWANDRLSAPPGGE